MTTPVTLPKLGMRPTSRARLATTVRLRLTSGVPAHPAAADHLGKVPAWMLGANDRFGTCGPTAVANHAVMTWKYLLGEDITVTDEAIFDLYRRSGNPGFDPATGAGDNGVDMTVMLSALVKGGITITHGDGTTEIAKPLCFAAHATGQDAAQAVTAIFGGTLFGVNLEVAQQTQTATRVWDYSPSAAWGGHAILAAAYTGSSAPHTVDESVVSWAEVIGTTDQFLAEQLSEAYCIVWPALWTHPAFMTGVDQAALAADYEDATGRPFPVPVPPQPDPTPDVHRDPADITLWNATRNWAGTHHVGSNRQAAAAVAAWAQAKGLN